MVFYLRRAKENKSVSFLSLLVSNKFPESSSGEIEHEFRLNPAAANKKDLRSFTERQVMLQGQLSMNWLQKRILLKSFHPLS